MENSITIKMKTLSNLFIGGASGWVKNSSVTVMASPFPILNSVAWLFSVSTVRIDTRIDLGRVRHICAKNAPKLLP